MFLKFLVKPSYTVLFTDHLKHKTVIKTRTPPANPRQLCAH